MKSKHLLSFFALAAVVCASCDPSTVELAGHVAVLSASPSSQKIASDGTASFTFSFSLKSSSGTPRDLSHFTATIAFEATGGSVSPTSATTDKNGNVTVVFTTPDPKSFTGGTVKGTIKNVKQDTQDGLFQQGDLARKAVKRRCSPSRRNIPTGTRAPAIWMAPSRPFMWN